MTHRQQPMSRNSQNKASLTLFPNGATPLIVHVFCDRIPAPLVSHVFCDRIPAPLVPGPKN